VTDEVAPADGPGRVADVRDAQEVQEVQEVQDAQDAQAVRAANGAFYDALERGDFDAMSDVWEHSDRVTVTHPGWPTIRGWGKVAASWSAIFRSTGYIQFVLTEEEVTLHGDTAWVTLDENIIQSVDDEPARDDGLAPLAGARATAINLFVRTTSGAGDGWSMVAHHSAPVG
jgi:ketosteroid isomerase-like protein